MKRLSCILASLIFAGLSYANDYIGLTTQPIGDLQPVEFMCKTKYSGFLSTPVPEGYVVVGEFHSKLCAGGGKNAWLTKVLESGDTICSAPHQAALNQIPNRKDTFNPEGYTIIQKGFDQNCPFDYDLETQARHKNNTATLQVLPGYFEEVLHIGSTFPSKLIINRITVRFDFDSNTTFYKQASNKDETTCSYYDAYGYLAQSASFSYECYGKNEEPPKCQDCGTDINTYHLTIPKQDTEYQAYYPTTYNIINNGPLNLVLIEGYNSDYLLKAKKLVNTTQEKVCFGALPEGYVEISHQYSPICDTADVSYKTINQATLQKIDEQLDFLCARNYLYGSTQIPNDYVVIEKLKVDICLPTYADEPNAYKVRKLKNEDIVCKDLLYEANRALAGEDDYGIIGETTLAECGKDENNAWRMKYLTDYDQVCKAGFDYTHYPDYVIDSAINLSSCPNSGYNALTIRRIKEPEDTICLPQFNNQDVEGFRQILLTSGFKSLGYTTLKQCGGLKAETYQLR